LRIKQILLFFGREKDRERRRKGRTEKEKGKNLLRSSKEKKYTRTGN
jgi:hypothetical protein